MSEHESRQSLRRGNSENCENNYNIHGRNRVSNDDPMAASYTEIAMQSLSSSKHSRTAVPDDDEPSPDDECLNDNTIPNKEDDAAVDSAEDYEFQNKSDKRHPKRPVSLLCDKSFPYDLEGTVRREGDMTHFVAENLEYKIKLSSPITKRDINQPNTSSKNSTPSTSAGILPKHFLQSHLAQIDSNVLTDIEIDAQYLAASVDNLTENLYNLLHSVSSITADNVEIHKNSVNKLTDNMDANIKCMYTIMAKTEEISKSMKPTEQLALRIREIKRLVDMLETNL